MSATTLSERTREPSSAIRSMLPGALACAIITAGAVALGAVEERLIGRPVIEALVLAIIIGMAVRMVTPSSRVGRAWAPGIRFVGKDLLELAVCLLGLTMDIPKLFASGPLLAIAIVVLVGIALSVGLAIGRAAGLSRKLAILVACGNAICGNSAIAAVAPAIDAEPTDVAASIALTALVGVAMVVGLPLLIGPLHLSERQFGILTGLTVYAVPQVLAAGFAVSVYSAQIAMGVKLARVLMLGPVVVFFSIRERRRLARADRAPLELRRVIPWFIGGFALLATARSMHVVPDAAADGARVAAQWLAVAAMAALGLSVDMRSLRHVGHRVILAVAGSLTALLVLAVIVIHLVPTR